MRVGFLFLLLEKCGDRGIVAKWAKTSWKSMYALRKGQRCLRRRGRDSAPRSAAEGQERGCCSTHTGAQRQRHFNKQGGQGRMQSSAAWDHLVRQPAGGALSSRLLCGGSVAPPATAAVQHRPLTRPRPPASGAQSSLQSAGEGRT